MMTWTKEGQAEVKQRKQNISSVCETVDAIIDEQIWTGTDTQFLQSLQRGGYDGRRT